MSSRQLPLRFAPFLPCGQAVSLRSALGRDPAGFERGNVDDITLGHGHGFGVRLFEPLATHLVGVPAVVADELEAFVRDVLGDAGDEVARAEHFKIALDLRVHPRAVNDRVAGSVGLHFLHRERVADDVLGEPLHVLAVVGRHALAAVDVEPGVPPTAQHPGAFGRQEPLLDQKRDDPCAEEFLQRGEAHVGHHVKKSAVHEEPVGDQRVEVGVEVEVFAEGMNGHDDARRAFGQTERGALELGQAAVGDAAEFLDEPAVEPEVGAEHLGDREREMPMWHRREDGLGQQRAEESHQAGSRRIQVNVITHDPSIGRVVFLNGYGLVTSRKHMSTLTMPRIEPRRVCALQPLHGGHQIALRRSEQQMVMVSHQHVAVNHRPASLTCLPKREKKSPRADSHAPSHDNMPPQNSIRMLRATPSSRQGLLLKSSAFASFCTLTPSFIAKQGA